MAPKRERTDYVSIVEACYRPNELDEAWLTDVLSAAEPLLDLGGGIGLSMVREDPTGRVVALSEGSGRLKDMLRASWPIIQQLDAETYRKFFYPKKPVVLASALVSAFAAPVQALFSAMMKHAGATDMLGMLGYPAAGWAFAMFVALDGTKVTNPQREALRRLRIHVEASLRLRLFASLDPAAVIRPDGKLEHVSEGTLDAATCDAIGAQARSIDRVRTKSGRADPDRALSVWHALVEGRFSLVEKVERDGKRYYHAFENAPHVRPLRAITETEALVLSLTLRGLSGKEVAYATGLSQGRISAALGQAAARLGLARREQLLRVGASLLQGDDDAGSADLTAAEREVLALVRSGLSNQQIAEARGTSINTVANQLAALLRKTGAKSRRALMVSSDPEGDRGPKRE